MNEDLLAIQHLLLYREFQAERDEILRHKWIESERVGRDIGFDKALLEWIIKHRAAWREWRRRSLPHGRKAESR